MSLEPVYQGPTVQLPEPPLVDRLPAGSQINWAKAEDSAAKSGSITKKTRNNRPTRPMIDLSRKIQCER